jgi:hypothetical protein
MVHRVRILEEFVWKLQRDLAKGIGHDEVYRALQVPANLILQYFLHTSKIQSVHSIVFVFVFNGYSLGPGPQRCYSVCVRHQERNQVVSVAQELNK